jgi:hypothetical protein
MPVTCFTKLKINEASVRVNRMQLDLDAIANFKTLSRAIQLGHRVSRALETERRGTERSHSQKGRERHNRAGA